MRKIVITFMTFLSIQAFAAKPDATPIGNAAAPSGGTFFYNLVAEPEILNPIYHSERVTSQIAEFVMDRLLELNPETNAWEPGLAEKYEVSKDGLTFTFKLRKNLKWSDGQPLTSDDVRFTIECVNDPAFKAVHRKSYYEDIAKIETPDPLTIKFVMKKKYYKTLEVLASQTLIVPKHIYGDPSKPLSKVMMGAGPYMMDQYNHGKSIELVRNPHWWGVDAKEKMSIGQAKFERVVFRFIKDENLQVEMLKKGQLDFLDLQPNQFAQKTSEPPFDTEIIKHKEENQDATKKAFYFTAWNLKNPLFQDRNVRIALAELMNRPMMIEKFRFGLSDLAAGPTYLRNEQIADPAVKPLPYDPKHASELLKKAGWEDHDKNGILDKKINGAKTEFRFTLLLPNPDYEKYFTSYKEDLKKAGIEMEIKNIEWNAFVKLLNEQKFDSLAMSWVVGSLEADPKQIWHSTSANLGGSNFISYKNPVVDKLIDKAREEMNPVKRRDMFRKVYRTIAEDAPYVWMFSTRYDLYAAWKAVGMTKGTMKYDRGMTFWWKAAN
jgi:peptide/nickel transport system substrate-binding protein/microcin C transport system substrate-binding protein